MSRLFAAVLIAAVAFVCVVILHSLGALGRLELLTHDARILSGVGRKTPRSDIVVAWIDQDAIDYMRRQGTTFPWPRSVYGGVVDYVMSGGAKAVVFDVLFTEPAGAEDDKEFAGVLEKTSADVLAFKFVTYRDDGFDDAETTRMTARGLSLPASASLPNDRGFALPIAEFEQHSRLLGFVNVRTDADKVHRGYDLLRTWKGKAYPSLALAAAMATASEGALAFDGDGLRIGAQTVAVDAHARMQLAFRGGPLTFEHVQLVNIFESVLRVSDNKAPIYPAARFKDKIVLVGINAEGYADVVPTPLSTNFPGVELHATALDNLLVGDPLRRLDLDLALGALAAVAGTALVFTLPGTLWPALALAALLGVIAASSLGLFAGSILLPTAAPLLGSVLAGGGAFLWRLTFEGKKRREMKRAFTSYMAPEVVAEVLRNPDKVKLGGETRHVTLLFTDLAGFTGLAEHLQPDELVAFLNDYFTRMCDRVLEQRGVIDKFIGDAIMAMFGAPLTQQDHSKRAVHAALGMLAEMKNINAEQRARGRPEVLTRIGIHTGDAVVGNMGSNKRFDYTAIGDMVNLASRLEGANKVFGTLCLVSETAWEHARQSVIGREVGLVRVKGREQPIRVYEPLALAGGSSTANAFVAGYDAALRALRQGQLAVARQAFAALAHEQPHDALLSLYIEKAQDTAWDGVFTLDTK